MEDVQHNMMEDTQPSMVEDAQPEWHSQLSTRILTWRIWGAQANPAEQGSMGRALTSVPALVQEPRCFQKIFSFQAWVQCQNLL